MASGSWSYSTGSGTYGTLTNSSNVSALIKQSTYETVKQVLLQLQ